MLSEEDGCVLVVGFCGFFCCWCVGFWFGGWFGFLVVVVIIGIVGGVCLEWVFVVIVIGF